MVENFNGITFRIIFMKKIIWISVVIFTFWSCASEDAGFDSNSKKEIMDSWAWKIFIFTDEGEFTPVKKNKNNVDNTRNGSPIFVGYGKGIYSNDLFFSNQNEKFRDPVVFANFNLTEK
jgi:hypothetical protein